MANQTEVQTNHPITDDLLWEVAEQIYWTLEDTSPANFLAAQAEAAVILRALIASQKSE